MKHLRNLAFLLPALSLSLSAVPLNTLIGVGPGSGLVVGDKVFYNFGYSVSCDNTVIHDCATLVADGLVTGIDPAAIQIAPDSTIPGLLGFDMNSPLKAISDGTHSTAVDITFTYDAAVTAAGGGNMISDVHLSGVDTRNPNGASNPPSVSIGESVFNLSGGAFLGNLQITDPPPMLASVLSLSTPVHAIAVSKDIELASGAGSANGTADFASLTTITQTLSQVPEPRAYAIVLALFLGLSIYNRKRRSA